MSLISAGSISLDSAFKRLQIRAPALFKKASHNFMCTLSILKQGKAKMSLVY